MMIGVKLTGDGAGMFGFGEISLAEYQRESAGRHPASAQNADQGARIDTSGQEYADGNVADQLQADGLFQEQAQIRYCAASFVRRGREWLAVVIVRMSVVCVVRQIPIG